MGYDVLNLPPGYLNEFDVDDVDQESIDFQSESPQSILQRIKDKVFSTNKFKNSHSLIGILLRADNKYSGPDCTAQDLAIQGTLKPGKKKYRLDTYKIRVPELHFMLAVPRNLKKPDKNDKLIIDSYPTIQAIDTRVQKFGVSPGDLVRVVFGNAGSMTRIYYAGPLDPGNVGITARQYKDCVDPCIKKYRGGGSTGDCIGKNINLAALDKATPLATGQGHTKDEIINESGSSWLEEILKDNANAFPGLKYISKFSGNGHDDNVEMKDGVGRNTFIFMPKGVDPKQNLEIIYFFHDNNKFSPNSDTEWKKMGTTFTKMVKKDKKFNGGRRNIIFVVPEMLWSAEKMSKPGIGYKRIQSQSSAYRGEKLARYKDRHCHAWGLNKPVWANNHKLFVGGYEGKEPKGKGDFKQFVTEVNKVLKEKFNVDQAKVQKITLAAERYGGAAISNLARNGLLGSSGPLGDKLGKIQLFHADYSGHENNHYHDNDLLDIVSNVNTKNVEIEVHLSSDGTNLASELPRKAFAAFLGKISSLTQEWISDNSENLSDTSKAVIDLLDEYKGQLNFIGKPTTQNVQSLKEQYNAGREFIKSNKNRTLRLSGPWAFVIFRGVAAKPSIDWISWLEDTNVPTAIASSEITKEKKNVIVLENSKFTDQDKKAFSKFKGKVLLYNSKWGADDTAQLKGKTAIVVPQGANLSEPYELIFYFHGITKGKPSPTNWRSHADGFHTAIQAQLNKMVTVQKRNVVYVTTQHNAHTEMKAEKATFGKENQHSQDFKTFLKDVVEKIKGKDNVSPQEGLGGSANPEFITLKSFSGGYYPVRAIVSAMTNNKIAGHTLQRIDYFDSLYGPKAYKDVFEKIFVDQKSSFNPGVDFEMQVYAHDTSTTADPNAGKGTWQYVKQFYKKDGCGKFNGCAEIKDGEVEAKLSKLDGLYLEQQKSNHKYGIVNKFAAKSLLDASKTPKFNPIKPKSAAETIKAADIPVAYDEEGNAFNHKGEQLSDSFDLEKPQLKCDKGQLDKHRPKTKPPTKDEDCRKKCKEELTTGATGTTPKETKGDVNCETNPLGLLDYGRKSDFNKGLKITAATTPKSWGKPIIGRFIKNVLENEIWTSLNEQNAQYPQKDGKTLQWIIRDISPKWANGIDMIRGHGSHREGIDFDMNLPVDWVNSKPGTKQPKRFQEHTVKGDIRVDYDKCIAMALLTIKQPGMANSMCLCGVKSVEGKQTPQWYFKKYILRRCDEIINGVYDQSIESGGSGMLREPNPAFKSLFSGFNETTKKKINSFFLSEPNHEDHFHFRLGTKTGSHQKKWPDKALEQLKNNGCDYKGPHPKSRLKWREYVAQHGYEKQSSFKSKK